MSDNQRATPSGGRIGLSDMINEFAGGGARRTGMAEAGTWIGLPAGTRHGFDSYWGKSNIKYIGTIVVTCSQFGYMSSSDPYYLPSTDGIDRESYIQNLKAGGYMVAKQNGATFGNGVQFVTRRAGGGGNYDTYRLDINGTEYGRWNHGIGSTTTYRLELDVYN